MHCFKIILVCAFGTTLFSHDSYGFGRRHRHQSPPCCPTATANYADAAPPADSARSMADRVKKAKDLQASGKTYPRGCSEFVAEVLGVPWESANSLMGSNPTNVGDNNIYKGLRPGDIAGWVAQPHGHVSIFIDEPGCKFIDVASNGLAPRKLGSGYGLNRPVFKSSKY
jgi:hypothetical protein